ncbi:ATP-dependent Clp protease proteolytic subunit [Floridanema aerugineum]|uniref:ATP-dependent Clp protease proteolytic subunit n=1 Tax=Floridaenema aerugineum BLCC-F46 TaxID=3153654 RepID=A0ABV4X1F4_9CYAN
MSLKIFVPLLSSISLTLLTTTLSPNEVMGQTSKEISSKLSLPQVLDAIDLSFKNKQIDPEIDRWLRSKRIVLLTGRITPELAERITSELIFLDAKAPGKDIYLYINSKGGEIQSGLAIYDTIKSLKSDVVTVSVGECSSMAAMLLASGTKGKRFALPNSRIMIHQPTSGVDGQASEIAIEAKEILYLKSLLNSLLAQLTGQPIKKIEVDSDRDFFMSAQEAKVYGIVDKVINQLPSASTR